MGYTLSGKLDSIASVLENGATALSGIDSSATIFDDLTVQVESFGTLVASSKVESRGLFVTSIGALQTAIDSKIDSTLKN